MTLIEIARAQDVGEVLDSAYSLSTLEEEELFDEKQKFVYSIFDRVLKSDKGKAFRRQYKDNHDAQSFFIKLVDYYTKTLYLRRELQKILFCIDRIKLDSMNQ